MNQVMVILKKLNKWKLFKKTQPSNMLIYVDIEN